MSFYVVEIFIYLLIVVMILLVGIVLCFLELISYHFILGSIVQTLMVYPELSVLFFLLNAFRPLFLIIPSTIKAWADDRKSE